MKDSIIFDLDGTLWDPREVLVSAWNDSLKRLGTGLSVDIERLTPCLGLPLDAIGDRLFPEISKEERSRTIETCCDDQTWFIRRRGGILYEGVKETLSELKKTYRLFIVSNCRSGYIEAFMYAHGMEEFFEDFEDNGRTGLLKDGNIRLVAERNRLKAPVYVGDTQMDGEACRKAEVPFILANYGFGDFKGYAAKIEDIRELPEIMSKL